MFQPDTLTTGVAPWRSAELYVAVRVVDSPGHSVTSLSLQIDVVSSLSPASSWPVAVPRRRSARRKKPTVLVVELLVIVTVTRLSEPAGPATDEVTAVALIDEFAGSACRALRFAYELIDACGWPKVLEAMTSGVAGIQ